MTQGALPHEPRAGPTKPAVRAVLQRELALGPTDHFVDVGPCTVAVTVEAIRRAGRVTALERKPDRLAVTRKNLAANGVDGDAVTLREAEAPEVLPGDADALFLGHRRDEYACASSISREWRTAGLVVEFKCVCTNEDSMKFVQRVTTEHSERAQSHGSRGLPNGSR